MRCAKPGEEPPCLATNAEANGVAYFLLGTVATLEACLLLADSALPESVIGPAAAPGAAVCKTVTHHHPAPEIPAPFASTCYCGTTPEWTAPQHEQNGIDAAYCTHYSAGWGTPFLMLAVGMGIVYLAGGIAYGVKAKALPPGIGAHPHAGLWKEGLGLVKDGMTLVKDGRRVGGGSAAGGPAMVVGVGGHGGSKKTKEKEKEKRDKEKKERSLPRKEKSEKQE